jgi:ABC-type dipeptide/oligopeptide/nickel transport system ATPase component
MPPAPLLHVRDLRTYFVSARGSGTARAVDGVSFDVFPGETLGIVGESGCGKSVTSLSILRLVPEPPGHILPGSLIEFEGRNLLTLAPRDLRAIRGNRVAMIFQEPLTSLNPVLTVGDQIAESAIVHQRLSRSAARARARDMLDLVGIPDPGTRAGQYPHELSGGMRQRVAIARTLILRPKIILMDEPFGALDPQTRMNMQDLLVSLWKEVQATVFFVTHSIEEAVFLGDRAYVMSGAPGTILEELAIEPADRPARLMQREPRFLETVNHLRDLISQLEEQFRAGVD